MLLERSVEWMIVESETYAAALEQTNVTLRYLLGTRSSVRTWWHTYLCCGQPAGRAGVVGLLLDVLPLNWRRSARPKSARPFFIA